MSAASILSCSRRVARAKKEIPMTQAPQAGKSPGFRAGPRSGSARRRPRRAALRLLAISQLAPLAMLVPLLARAQTIDVGTDGTAKETFPTIIQSVGPFPFSDLGIDATALVSPKAVTATVGGQTAFTPLNAPTGGQSLVPGTTTMDFSYTPSWTTGAVSTTGDGTLQAGLSYNIGPFSGSKQIIGTSLNTSVSGNLMPALQNGGTGLASNTAVSPSVSLSTGLSASVGFCPFCVTLASVSFGVTVGAQLKQTVDWTPTTTYGDLVWYSTSQTLAPTDKPVFVAGSGGQVSNAFDPASQLKVTNGETIYMNMLPAVELTMPIKDQAAVTVPASFFINYDVFGDSGGKTFPLGNLYDLQTGTDTLNFDAAWYGPDFYSVPITATVPVCGIACFAPTFTTTGGGGYGQGSDGIPLDTLPTDQVGDPWPGGVGGPGTDPTTPLFTNGACSPTDPSDCADNIAFTSTSVPEPGSLALLATGLLVIGIARSRSRIRPGDHENSARCALMEILGSSPRMTM
jgi:hypothetical protein